MAAVDGSVSHALMVLGSSRGLLISVALGHVFAGCCSNIYLMELINNHICNYANIFITFLQTGSVVVLSYFACLILLPREKRKVHMKKRQGEIEDERFPTTVPRSANSGQRVSFWPLATTISSAVSKVQLAWRQLYLPSHRLSSDKLQLAAYYNFMTSFFGNVAIDFGVEFHYQIIVRSGTVLANIPMGKYYFGKSYSWSVIFCAVMVSVGIAIYCYKADPKPLESCPVEYGGIFAANSTSANASAAETSLFTPVVDYMRLAIRAGVFRLYTWLKSVLPPLLMSVVDMLIKLTKLIKLTDLGFTSLIISIYYAVLLSNYQSQLNQGVVPSTLDHSADGDLQNELVKPHWALLLFYIHYETLKMFKYIFPWILYTGWHFMAGAYNNLIVKPTVADSLIGSGKFFGLLLGNSVTQYVCLAGVYQLSYNNFNPLTLALVLNFRKFISAGFSFYLTGRELDVYKMVGGGLVVVFTFAYVFVSSSPSSKKVSAIVPHIKVR